MGYLELLAEWRETRDPALAAQIVEQADLAARAHPIARRRVADPDEFHALWMKLAEAANPSDTPWLAHMLTHKLDLAALSRIAGGDSVTARWRERAVALRSHAPNPVLGAACLRILRSGELSYAGSFTELHEPLFELVRRSGDPDLRGGLEELRERYRGDTQEAGRLPMMEQALSPLIDGLGASPRPSSGSSMALGAKTKRVTEGALREAVFAAPDDDGPRLVYADWLAERSDPLGELIVLQCAATSSPPSKKASVRIGSLLRTYKELWLGELARVVTNVEFRRGFLASFGLAQNAAASASEWKRLAESPALRTVEEIQVGRGNKRLFLLFVTSPQATALRVLHHVGSTETLTIARGEPRRIDTIVTVDVPPLKLLDEIFGGSPGLPRLDRLVVSGARLGPSSAAERWEAIAKRHARALPRLRRLDVVLPFHPKDRETHAAIVRIADALLPLPMARLRFAVEESHVRLTVAGDALRIELPEAPPNGLGPFLRRFAQRGFARVSIVSPAWLPAAARAPVVDLFGNASEELVPDPA